MARPWPSADRCCQCCGVSYDFALLTPEVAGATDQEALAAADVLYDQEPAAEADPRLRRLVAELEVSGAADEEDGWLSVWPVEVLRGGLALPTTYADVDTNMVTLLRLAARERLVLVDLNAERVHRPEPGEPIGVMAGDGSRLGAVTREKLESLLRDLPDHDPWLVLERAKDVYVQTYRQPDGTFLLERRDGSAHRHFTTSVADRGEVVSRMWAWVSDEPTWSRNLAWERLEL